MIFIFLMLCIYSFSQVEEEARKNFSKAFLLWLSGNAKEAKELLEETLSRAIYAEDIPEFWYLKAKINIDLLNVQKAYNDLKNLLIITPGKFEVFTLVKEVDYLLEKVKPGDINVTDSFEIKGFSEGIEYFYTPTDINCWGDRLYVLDTANSRLVVYKGKKLDEVIDLPFEPRNVEISPGGELFFSSKEGKLYHYEKGNFKEIGKLRNPVLAGFTRSGKLVGYDINSVFVYDGKYHFFKIPGYNLITDAEIRKNVVYLFNARRNSIITYDICDGKIKEIPLPIPTKFFEIYPDGRFILLGEDGAIYIFDGKNVSKIVEASDWVINIEYIYPFLFLLDWRENKIIVKVMKADEPILVRIDTMKIDEEKLYLFVRFESLYGDLIHLANMYSFVREAGGRILFDVKLSEEKIVFYTSDENFLTERIKKVKRGKVYSVVIPARSFFDKTCLVTLRSKGIKIWIEGDASRDLKNICYFSGGGIGSPRFKKYPIWIFSFKYVKPTTSEIIPISVEMVLGDGVFSDTVYITRWVIEFGLQGAF